MACERNAKNRSVGEPLDRPRDSSFVPAASRVYSTIFYPAELPPTSSPSHLHVSDESLKRLGRGATGSHTNTARDRYTATCAPNRLHVKSAQTSRSLRLSACFVEPRHCYWQPATRTFRRLNYRPILLCSCRINRSLGRTKSHGDAEAETNFATACDTQTDCSYQP